MVKRSMRNTGEPSATASASATGPQDAMPEHARIRFMTGSRHGLAKTLETHKALHRLGFGSKGALAVDLENQPFLLQIVKGLTNGDTADAERFHHVIFRGHFAVGGKCPISNAAAQNVANLRIQRHRRCGIQHARQGSTGGVNGGPLSIRCQRARRVRIQRRLRVERCGGTVYHLYQHLATSNNKHRASFGGNRRN